MEFQPEPTLLEYVRYNQWANQKLMAICMTLDEALLTANIPGTYGTIPATFTHLLRAEADFVNRIDGTGPQPPFSWDNSPSLAQLSAFEAVVAQAFLDTLERVPPTQNVHEEGNGWKFDYQARVIFMSLFYHGVSHRTDITTFLASHGIELPELDVWGYLSDHMDRFGAKIVKG